MTYIEIPEDKIVQTIAIFESSSTLESPTYLITALEIGSLMRREGLTPFYILVEEESKIIITSREQMENRLH